MNNLDFPEVFFLAFRVARRAFEENLQRKNYEAARDFALMPIRTFRGKAYRVRKTRYFPTYTTTIFLEIVTVFSPTCLFIKRLAVSEKKHLFLQRRRYWAAGD